MIRLKRLVNWYDRVSHTIAFRVFLIFTLIASVINITMGFVSYDNTLTAIKKDQQIHALKLLDITESYLNTYVKNIQATVMTLAELNFLKEYGKVDSTIIKSQMNIFFKNNIEYIDAVHFIGIDGKYISTDIIRLQLVDNVSQFECYQGSLKNPNSVYWSKPYKSVQNDIIISCSHGVVASDGSLAGVVIIDMNFNKINKLTYSFSLNDKEAILLLDENGLVISAYKGNTEPWILSDILRRYSINESLYKELKRYKRGFIDYTPAVGTRSILYYREYGKLGWKIINAVDYDVFNEKLKLIQRSFVISNIAFILLIIIAAFFFAKYISFPLKRMSREMEIVEKGDFSIRVNTKRKDEIGRLGLSFNSMIIKIEELIENIIKAERAKKENDFKVLQAQINPHFLYNTLSSINCMVSLNKSSEIQNMVTALINLLQASINKMDEVITIRQELENIKNYIVIQKIRYGDKFDIIYHTEAKVLDFKVPKLILQPVVENSIFHGVQPKTGKGTIRISISLEQSKILIIVEDDGIGMSKEKLDHILGGFDFTDKSFSMVGIKNVNDRIKLYFGKEYGIDLESIEGSGCKVKITVPVVV